MPVATPHMSLLSRTLSTHTYNVGPFGTVSHPASTLIRSRITRPVFANRDILMPARATWAWKALLALHAVQREYKPSEVFRDIMYFS